MKLFFFEEAPRVKYASIKNNEECALCLDSLQNELRVISMGHDHFFHACFYEDEEYTQSICSRLNNTKLTAPL